MNYDLTLFVELLKLVKDDTTGLMLLEQLQVPGYESDYIIEHLKLLIDEDLVKGTLQWTDQEISGVVVGRLTMKGQQLFNIVRDEPKWNIFLHFAYDGSDVITKENFEAALNNLFRSSRRKD